MIKHWTPSELATLRRLRERFLSADTRAGDYWKTTEDLALYDVTFAERIGWKWDAVLTELSARGWRPQSRHLMDFGCGSGVASRRVAQHWPGTFTSLTLHDRSPLAAQFAAECAQRDFPSLVTAVEKDLVKLPEDTLLVLSHVLNEVANSGTILALARQAREILWVEAGAHEESRRLVADIREPLLADGSFVAVAPCTHQSACGLRSAANARHWCHSFAPVPSEVFQSARWAEFSREIGIDLRALPYSFLVIQRPGAIAPTPPGFSRVIGRARDYKGYSKILSCQSEGVTDFTLQKRDDPKLLRQIQAAPNAAPCRWTLRNDKIIAGEWLQPEP